MSSVRQLHEQAMSSVDRALQARREGRDGEATQYFATAFEAEREAALLLVERGADAEPTRSILLRSAATLALDCDRGREAERLIAMALLGEPPKEIVEELREVWDRARHLRGPYSSFQEVFNRHIVRRLLTTERDEEWRLEERRIMERYMLLQAMEERLEEGLIVRKELLNNKNDIFLRNFTRQYDRQRRGVSRVLALLGLIFVVFSVTLVLYSGDETAITKAWFLISAVAIGALSWALVRTPRLTEGEESDSARETQ